MGQTTKKTGRYDHCESCPSRGTGLFCELEKLSLDDLSRHKVTNFF